MKWAAWYLRQRVALAVLASAVTVTSVWPARTSAQSSQARVESAIANLRWREIGPTVMGGRVADIAVVESNPSVFYVGAATGGVWKTVNHGTSFEPVFEGQPTASIGDVTVAPSNPNIVWVGTGEPQNRQSSPWGNGVYKSTDAGKTWTHMGLMETRHIGRIRIHPRNPDIVYVAAVGHLWGANPERGVYKTTDGGASWQLVLSVDDHTGAIDLAMDHQDPETLFAAMYQRQRTAWGFNGGGPGSGIYRTTDGGKTWTRLRKGLPEGDLGRIGIDVYRRDGNMVFALVEADAARPGQGFGPGGGGGGGDAERATGLYRSTDRGESWEKLSSTNNRPMYYSQIRIDPNDPERLYAGGANLYKSVDGGRTFTSDAARDVHSDHHALWIDPNNSDHLILGGDGGVSISWDRANSWRQLMNLPISQFYEISADMRDPYHVCGGLQDNGSWCAPSDTRSNQGIRPKDWYNVGSGDGFYAVLHGTNSRIMFAESQGGNITRVDLVTGERTRMRPVDRSQDGEEDGDLRWNWDTPVVLSAHDPSTVYIGANVLFKSTDLGMTWQAISGDLTRHIDRQTLSIMGVRGSQPMMSANDGTSSYGNLTTISESPLNRDVIYTGSDDGTLSVTRDGGATWSNLTGNIAGLPSETYVSRVVASRFDEGTVYATFDGHRSDDFKPHVFVSTDYGHRWRAIIDGLPEWSVNIFAEHPRNPDLVFVGNEIGVYVSIDRGQRWVRMPNLPTVPVDDILVHPRENDLILGTHGRGIWIMSDITPLEQLTPPVLASTTHLFPVRTATSFNLYTPQGWTPGEYEAANPSSGALIRYYLRDNLAETSDGSGGMSGTDGSARPAAGDSVRITILDAQGSTVRELVGPSTTGIHEVDWDLRLAPPYEDENGPGGGGGGGGFFGGGPRGPKVLPGTYTVRLDAAGRSLTTDLVVRLDPRVEITAADLRARQDALMSAYGLAKPLYEARQATQRLGRQLSDVSALLRGNRAAPQTLADEVSKLREDVRNLSQEINRAGAGARGSFAIEASTTRPTADQLWQLDQAWSKVPDLISRLNAVITDRLPAIYRQLNEHGIRPDPGSPIVLPQRPGSDR
jgi:photosystem II stability/assembly factor-like uncharacterized protein